MVVTTAEFAGSRRLNGRGKTGGPNEDVNNRLEINWNQSQFHHYHMKAVECFDTAFRR